MAGRIVTLRTALSRTLFGRSDSYPGDNKPSTDDSKQSMITAATAYLDALVSHDPRDVRLAADVRRTENGEVTGDGADAILQSLRSLTEHGGIIDKRDVRWFVDINAHEAIVFYILDLAGDNPSTSPGETIHLSQRFRVEHGLIMQIETIYSISAQASEGSGW